MTKTHNEGRHAADDPVRPRLWEANNHVDEQTERGCAVHHRRLDDDVCDEDHYAREVWQDGEAGLARASACVCPNSTTDDQDCIARRELSGMY